jgi:hypothetical protein
MRTAEFDTAILLIIFNRPETTRKVFDAIARVRPRRLLVAADGPRPDRPEDVANCAAARAVTEAVDWDCDVTRNYATANLGCGRGPATAISWAFDQEPEAIVLEDDCLPDASFFPYCAELLARFRDDERVMQICGRNRLFPVADAPYSYAFSCQNICWGWASWRRAWRHFAMAVPSWPELRETSWLADLLHHPVAVEHWRAAFDRARAAGHDADFWDHQWTFACWAQSGLSIVPHENLVVNLGFGDHATHTKWIGDIRASQPLESIGFPLRHPPYVVRDREGDERYLQRALLDNLAAAAQAARDARGSSSRLPAALRRGLHRWLTGDAWRATASSR